MLVSVFISVCEHMGTFVSCMCLYMFVSEFVCLLVQAFWNIYLFMLVYIYFYVWCFYLVSMYIYVYVFRSKCVCVCACALTHICVCVCVLPCNSMDLSLVWGSLEVISGRAQ